MKRKKDNWRESRGFCIDASISTESPFDRLYKIIKKVEKENPEANSQKIYILACEYTD